MVGMVLWVGARWLNLGVATEGGHVDPELGDLTVEVPRSQTLAERFDTVHLCFDAAPAVIAAPSIVARSPGRSVSTLAGLRCGRSLRGCQASRAWRS